MSDINKINDDELLKVAGGRQSDLQVAYDVIDGRYGNGQDRINRLRAAGYDAAYIQSIVNAILRPSACAVSVLFLPTTFVL